MASPQTNKRAMQHTGSTADSDQGREKGAKMDPTATATAPGHGTATGTGGAAAGGVGGDSKQPSLTAAQLADASTPGGRAALASAKGVIPHEQVMVATAPPTMSQIGGDVDAKYRTSDHYFRVVLATPAESFAIEGPPETTPIFVAERNDRIVDVFKGMIDKNIMSVPVLLRDERRYFGFLDMVDIVRYIVQHFGPEAHRDMDFWELVKEEEAFREKKVHDIMTYPVKWRNPFHPVVRGYSAAAVIEPLAREPELHRVPIIDRDTRQMFNLVTASQVIRWEHRNIHTLGTVADKPLEMFATMVLKPVVIVNELQNAIEAFTKMISENVYGVAVVNDEGKLVGALSLRDIKLISHDARFFWRLNQTVKNFSIKLRHEFSEKHKRPHKAIIALPSTTLRQVVTDMAEQHIQRIFIVNDPTEKKPIGVVSIKDVLLEILGS